MGKIVCTDYTYESEKIGEAFDNYKIALISDMHCREFGDGGRLLADMICRQQPDIIIIAGDMVTDHGMKITAAKQTLVKLADICPVYYAPGNHEMKLSVNQRTIEKYNTYVSFLNKTGINYLDNRSVDIKKQDEILRISGLNIEERFYGKLWNKIAMDDDYIPSYLKPCSDNRFELLIAHNPDYFESYSRWGADIVLSGHIHGGIVVLPFIGGVIAPTLRLFPHYDFGRFEHGGSTMFLTRGLGAHTIPVRIFNPPEVVSITLQSIKNK